MSTQVSVLFLLTKEIPNLRSFFRSVILFVKPVSLCTRTGKLKITVAFVRNIAVRSDSQKTSNVLVTIKIGTTGRKTEVVANTLLFPTITGFPLTEIPFGLNQFTIFVPKLKDTTQDLSQPVRIGFGFATAFLLKISTLLLIFLFLQLL